MLLTVAVEDLNEQRSHAARLEQIRLPHAEEVTKNVRSSAI